MSPTNPKIHLPVTKDLNWGYKFSKYPYRVQLSWDIRKGWFWLEQYAKRLGMETFFEDFLKICSTIEKDNVVRKANGEYPIGIFNLYLESATTSTHGKPRNP